MGILRRFKDIMSSNINALLDKAENPEKMIDQYMRNVQSDLGKVKAETSTVMAEEQRAKRALNECTTNVEKMEKYALKALEAENEGDARTFLEKKAALVTKQTELQQAYDLASANTDQMRKMHDKLVEDVGKLEARRAMIKSKAALAKTKEHMNDLASSVDSASYSMSSFDRMEDKVNRVLDEANAMEELNGETGDNIEDLTSKYEASVNVDDELAALREKLKQNQG